MAGIPCVIYKYGGETGIHRSCAVLAPAIPCHPWQMRTLGTSKGTLDFESSAFDHSAISPKLVVSYQLSVASYQVPGMPHSAFSGMRAEGRFAPFVANLLS